MITLCWVPNTVLEAGANDCFNLNALVSGLQSQDLSCPSSPHVTVNAFFSEPCPSSKNYAWETEDQDSDHPKSTLDRWLGKLTTKKGINLCLLITSVDAPAAWLSHQIQSVNTAQNPWEGMGGVKNTHTQNFTSTQCAHLSCVPQHTGTWGTAQPYRSQGVVVAPPHPALSCTALHTCCGVVTSLHKYPGCSTAPFQGCQPSSC